MYSDTIEDSEEGANDFEVHAVGAGQWYSSGELQRANLFWVVDERRVGLVKLGVHSWHNLVFILNAEMGS